MAAKSPARIQYEYFRTTFRLKNPGKISAWIEQVVKSEGKVVGSLVYVFCIDSYLLKINREYLDHDTLTDIITFQYSDPADRSLDGEIYISVPRVRENARTLGIDPAIEFRRVIIHGVLHLLGYGDKSKKEENEMRRREEKWLKAW
jgi:rRNA maturation RNase YbeY